MNKKIMILLIVIGIVIVGSVCILNNMNSDNGEGFKLIFHKNGKFESQKLTSEIGHDGEQFDVYAYNGEVKIIIDNKEYYLKEAFDNNKITALDILNKAKKDAENKTIETRKIKDGGSIVYVYRNYTIIKRHALISTNNSDGVKYDIDMYIGTDGLD